MADNGTPIFTQPEVTAETLTKPQAAPEGFSVDQLFPVIGSFDDETTVESVFIELGRLGGPSEAGWHSWEEAARCPRADLWIRQGRGADSSSRTALDTGAILHEMLSHYYLGHLNRATPEPGKQEAYVEKLMDRLTETGHGEVASAAHRLYAPYSAHYAFDNDSYLKDYEVVGVERYFSRDFPWGGRYTGRVDLLLKGPDGYVIVDHKTSGREDRDFLDGWRLEPQMLGLAWCVAKTLRPVIAYSINGIIKTAMPKFRRMDFGTNKKLIRDWLRMMEWYSTMRRLGDQAGSPPNFSQCIRRYGRCKFWDACVYGLRPDLISE